MPDKNKTNLAKTPLFSRFFADGLLQYYFSTHSARINVHNASFAHKITDMQRIEIGGVEARNVIVVVHRPYRP